MTGEDEGTLVSSPTIAERLAAAVADLDVGRLPAELRHQFRRALLDYLAATIAGAQSAVARTVQDYFLSIDPSQQSTLIGRQGRLSPPNAAFCNGTSAHALELDDGYTPGSVHPGAVVFSAVLPVAEALGLPLERVEVAVVAGFEVTLRLSRLMHPGSWARGFHNTAVHGVFGAAAAVAKLLELPADRIAHAFGLAGSHAAGLFEFLGTGAEVKRLHPGKAARDGIICAELAARGITGPLTVFEGERGYFRAYSDRIGPVEQLFDGFGRRFEMMNIYVKPYPCCRHLHGPIDLVRRIKQQRQQLDPDSIERIEVATYEVAARHRHRVVHDWLDAQMSIPWAVAVALLHDRLGVERFDPAAPDRDRIEALMARVEVTVDPWCQEQYPAKRPAVLRIRTRDGRLLEERAEYPLGEPQTPLSDADLELKLRTLAEPILGERQVSGLIEAVWGSAPLGQLLEQAAARA
ncbi:MAG TPA: MmgE/PrpD family protein [Bacillota bacterium]